MMARGLGAVYSFSYQDRRQGVGSQDSAREGSRPPFLGQGRDKTFQSRKTTKRDTHTPEVELVAHTRGNREPQSAPPESTHGSLSGKSWH